MITLEHAIQLPSIVTTPNKTYFPMPNIVDVVITDELAPMEFTRTAFMLPIRDRALILAQNQRRGVEFAGGHIEEGETSEEAARRECHEETGFIVDEVAPIGFLRMISQGEAPEGYAYPHPISFQQFFAGRVKYKDPTFVPTDECDTPIEYGEAMAGALLALERLPFYEAALKKFG